MKKNAMLKIAAILMVAVLLTTCAISSTFAKYVTKQESSATSTARAAKWGLEFAVKGSENAIFTKQVSNTGLVIKSEDSFVVAPVADAQTATGENAVIGVTVSGKPEVAYRLLVKPVIDLAYWTTDGNDFYCPVTFKFGSGNVVAQGSYTEAQFEEAIASALATAILGSTPTAKDDDGFYYLDYAAGTTPVAGNTTLTWNWEFDGDETKDDKDTALGNAAADPDIEDPTISINFVIKAEQIAQIAA